MFQGLSNLASLMKNAQQIQGRAQEMKDRLASVRVEGSAGGGMVKVEATGDQRITAIRIEPGLFDSGDREMIEDLVASAVNQAIEHSREEAAKEMANLADGLGIPGLEDAFSKFGLVVHDPVTGAACEARLS